MNHIRAHIRLNTKTEYEQMLIDAANTPDSFTVEDFTGRYRVNMRSAMGMVYYAMAEFNDEMYLVNETNNGYFPSWVDKYRKDSSN